jgi:hypothetical protein
MATYPDSKHNAVASITLPRAVTQKMPACSANCPLLDLAVVFFGDGMHGYRGQLNSRKRRPNRCPRPVGFAERESGRIVVVRMPSLTILLSKRRHRGLLAFWRAFSGQYLELEELDGAAPYRGA